MNTISLDAVAKILDLSPHRIEQWIARKQFIPRDTDTRGKKREWDLAEVIRLALFARLATELRLKPLDGRRIPAEAIYDIAATEAGRATPSWVHSFKNDEAYLVCYKSEFDIGWQNKIVEKRELGDFLSGGCRIPTIVQERRRGTLGECNSDDVFGPAEVAVVINIDIIEKRLRANWPVPQG